MNLGRLETLLLRWLRSYLKESTLSFIAYSFIFYEITLFKRKAIVFCNHKHEIKVGLFVYFGQI